MTGVKPSLKALFLCLVTVALAACPAGGPLLNVSPGAIAFGAHGVNATLRISNLGGQTLTWQLEEVVRVGDTWTAQDVPWLSTDAVSGSVSAGTDTVSVLLDRSGQNTGTYNNAGVRVTSNGGERVVPVSFSVAATLSATPTQINLTPGTQRAQFTIVNSGTAAASWAIRYLDNPAAPELARDLPPDFAVNPGAAGSTVANGSTLVVVDWTVERDDFGLLVESAAGSTVITIRFASAVEGLEVTPIPLRLFISSTDQTTPGGASKLRIRNRSGVVRSWSLNLNSLTDPGAVPPIGIGTVTGSTPAGQVTEVNVFVSNPTTVAVGSGNYELTLNSGNGFIVVPIIVEVMPLPEIAISEPPQENTTRPEVNPIELLDLGRTEVVGEFWIANVGVRGSSLFFNITYEGQGDEDSLIASVEPLQGDTNGPDEDFYLPGTNILIDGVPIKVVVDRTKLQEDVEFRTITVEAMDSEFEDVLDVVEKKTIRVRVERQPLTIEGAENRSRPPYVSRFVFLARDTFGEVIPTQTPEDRERLTFEIFEDEVPLDLSETNQFLSNELRANIAVLLDFTGSMYNAGTEDEENPLDPGEAVELMKDAVAHFLDDLPADYRVALLYYNDRQQQNRVIHQFSTDRASLKSALSQFQLLPAQYGVSEINDALVDSMQLLAAADAGETLPFDDADVRALIYITDGEDNASTATVDDVVLTAEDTRVRLYPVAYAPTGGAIRNLGEMIEASFESGGHLYRASQVQQLTRLFASEKSIVLSPSTSSGENRAYFRVENIGTAPLSWSLAVTDGEEWIQRAQPDFAVAGPGAAFTVTVTLDPTSIPIGDTVEGEIEITSSSGNGRAVIRMTVGSVGGVKVAEDVQVLLFDEPGTIWREQRNQAVLTYVTPKQEDFEYLIRAVYEEDDGTLIQGPFERDAIFFPGNVRAGHISMTTSGITRDLRTSGPNALRAEAYVHADYVPRNVKRFSMRFWLELPPDAVADLGLDPQTLLPTIDMQVQIAPGGLLDSQTNPQNDWRLLPQGNGKYTLVTEESNFLPYGAFGSLLKLTFTNLQDLVAAYEGSGRVPEFQIGMRVDNQIYVSPATPTQPSDTKFFLYPGGLTFPERFLSVKLDEPDLAPPARDAQELAFPAIDPEAPNAWDRDEDGLPDFDDPQPDDESLPGNLILPNPVEIPAAVDVFQLLFTNNRLDTIEAWSILPESVPTWITEITFGNPPPGPGDPRPEPLTTLAPGQSEFINLHVDRTGLPPGTADTRATLVLDTSLDYLGTEEIPVTIVVPAR